MLKPNFYTKKTIEGNYGRFIIEPLPVSFGQSIGQSLRRTLLSSLKGAAITQVKIKGVSHLFTTLKGVKESVLEIVLNLKQLKFEVADKGPYKISLSKKGIGQVYGKDFEGEVKPTNGDLYIAEITDSKTELEIEAIVEVDYGYRAAEENEKKEFGFIAVDAFFSPIKKVNVKVEETRIGRKSNFERLIIELETDGSVTPDNALKQASNLLRDYFAYFLSDDDKPQEKVKKIDDKDQDKQFNKMMENVIIDELNLPSRVINALLREKIETVADLIRTGKERLIEMKGLGKKSIELIEAELKKMNVNL